MRPWVGVVGEGSGKSGGKWNGEVERGAAVGEGMCVVVFEARKEGTKADYHQNTTARRISTNASSALLNARFLKRQTNDPRRACTDGFRPTPTQPT